MKILTKKPENEAEFSCVVLPEDEAHLLRWATGKIVRAGEEIWIEKGFSPSSIDVFLRGAKSWMDWAFPISDTSPGGIKALHCAIFGYPREAIKGTMSPAASTLMVVGLANLEEMEAKIPTEGHLDLHSILQGWDELALPSLPGIVTRKKKWVLRFAQALAIAWMGEA